MHVGTPEQLKSALEARIAELSEPDVNSSTTVTAEEDIDDELIDDIEDVEDAEFDIDSEYFDALFDALSEALGDEYTLNMSSQDDAIILNVTSGTDVNVLNIPYSDLSFDIDDLDSDVEYIKDYIITEL